MAGPVKGVLTRGWSNWLSHVGVDWFLAGGLVLTHYLLHRFREWPSLLQDVPLDQRPGLYTATALVVTLAGTLGSTAVSQYMSGRGDRMVELKRVFPGQLSRTWRSMFLGSFAAAGALVTAYVLDSRTPGPHIGTWLFEGAVLFSVLRYVRLSMLFSAVIEISAQDDADPLGGMVDLSPSLFTRDTATHR